MYENATLDTRATGVERASYDPEGESLVVTIADAVARAEGVSVEDLRPRVVDVVDPDALERLFGPASETDLEAEVSFQMADHTVVVRNTGEVLVTQTD
jgi:preprotein translocase subunit SecD